MSNFTDHILVKIAPSSPDFVAISTFDIFHGKSSRFLLHKSDLIDLLDNEQGQLLDTDVGSYIQITHNRRKLHFNLTWLHRDYRDDVTGYIHSFDIPEEQIMSVLNGQRIHHVEHNTDENTKAKLTLTDGSQLHLKKICQDKLSRHAIRRFFRDNFNYGTDENLTIFPDRWVNGFYFECDRLSGGIVRYEDYILGNDGREYSTKRSSTPYTHNLLRIPIDKAQKNDPCVFGRCIPH